MVNKAYKYRVYPTKEQVGEMSQLFGHTRFVYNYFLRIRQDAWYNNQEKINYHDTSALLTQLKKEPDFLWLKDVSSVPLQQALRHLHTGFLNFWSGKAKHPTFKKKTRKQSATFAASAFKWSDGKLTVGKITGVIDIRLSRKFEGKPSTVTLSKDSYGRYFVSLLVEEYIALKPVIKKTIGIDLGISNVVITSDGFKFGSPKFTRKYEKKLAKKQRILAKKKKGSKNKEKARLAVAKVHAKITDSRMDFTHKLTTQLINENQVICVETLAVKNMVKNKYLSKSIHDSGWGELLRQLEYKAKWYGRTLVGIDRWYPSSKRCSDCGYTMDKMPLNVRVWQCPECKSEHCRDINAARNIKAEGLSVLAFGESVSGVSSIGMSCSQ
jgi:putative transposase